MKGGNIKRIFDAKKNRSAGHFKFQKYDFIYDYDLLDYLKGGMKITADFLIDFSESNQIGAGKTLHDLPKAKNPYLLTISHAYKVLKQYASNRSVKLVLKV